MNPSSTGVKIRFQKADKISYIKRIYFQACQEFQSEKRTSQDLEEDTLLNVGNKNVSFKQRNFNGDIPI